MPALAQGSVNVSAYFPQGVWYDAWDVAPPIVAPSQGMRLTLHVPLGDVPVHVRGGSILPMSRIDRRVGSLTTNDVRAAPLSLLVALPRPVRRDTFPCDIHRVIYIGRIS